MKTSAKIVKTYLIYGPVSCSKKQRAGWLDEFV